MSRFIVIILHSRLTYNISHVLVKLQKHPSSLVRLFGSTERIEIRTGISIFYYKSNIRIFIRIKTDLNPNRATGSVWFFLGLDFFAQPYYQC